MPQIDQPTAGAERLPTTRRRERTRRIVHLLILSFAAIMFVDAIVGEQGVVALARARHEYERMTGQLQRLKTENDLLRQQNQRLRNDRAAQEEAARRELGLMKPGEKLFIVKDPPAPSQP